MASHSLPITYSSLVLTLISIRFSLSAVALSFHTEPIWRGLFKRLCYQTLHFSLQWPPSLTYFHNPRTSSLCVCVCVVCECAYVCACACVWVCVCMCVCVCVSVHELYACVHLVCTNILMHMEDRSIHRMPSWNTLHHVFYGSPRGTQLLAGVITDLKKSFEFKLARSACILQGCEKVLIKPIRKSIFVQIKEHIIY